VGHPPPGHGRVALALVDGVREVDAPERDSGDGGRLDHGDGAVVRIDDDGALARSG
jgi:hypothetical protein